MKERLIYILVIALTTNLLRVLPASLMTRPVKSRFVKSFLYYVPYVTLAVMTVPDMITAAGSTLAGVLALAAGVVAAWFGLGLLPVAGICCAVVFLTGLF